MPDPSAEPAPPEPSRAPQIEPRRRAVLERDRVAGFSIIAVVFSASLVISWKASQAVRPNIAPAPGPPTSEGLSGFPEHVDPLAALPLAEGLTARTQLRRIVAISVGSDGTVDLRQARANIRYEFDSAAGEGPEAPRPAGTVRQGHYCGRQSVQVKPEGIAAEPDQPRAVCRPGIGEPLPEPRCGPRQLWALALQRGASADGRAVIEYYRSQEGPAWRFSLSSPRTHFVMYGDCEHELTGDAARSLGP
jgi:hypothetical protein